MTAERMAAERMALGSLATDPLVRLQMAGINPEVMSIFCVSVVISNSVHPRCLPTHTPTYTCTQMQQLSCWDSRQGSQVTFAPVRPTRGDRLGILQVD